MQLYLLSLKQVPQWFGRVVGSVVLVSFVGVVVVGVVVGVVVTFEVGGVCVTCEHE